MRVLNLQFLLFEWKIDCVFCVIYNTSGYKKTSSELSPIASFVNVIIDEWWMFSTGDAQFELRIVPQKNMISSSSLYLLTVIIEFWLYTQHALPPSEHSKTATIWLLINLKLLLSFFLWLALTLNDGQSFSVVCTFP